MKKRIPLAILETLQPITNENAFLVTPITDAESVFKLIDNDKKSDFFFKVVKAEMRSGEEHFYIKYKPLSKESTIENSEWLKVATVAIRLKAWLALLGEYNKLQTIYDDPILKSYEEKFNQSIDILDDDAEVAPFNLEQQLYLDDYLSTVDKKLEELKKDKSKEDINLLTDLQSEAADIKGDLTRISKRKTIRRLSKLWAKAQKVGLDVIKEIFVSVTAEITKRLLTGGN